jgi:integrase
VASIEKAEGITDERGRQAYRIRWSEWPVGVRVPREHRVYGHAEAKAFHLERQSDELSSRARRRGKAARTLTQATTDWLEAYASRPRKRTAGARVQPTSWDEALRTLTLLVEQLGGNLDLTEVTLHDLEVLSNERCNIRTGEPASDGTKARMVGVLKAFFSDATRSGWITTNPAANLSAHGRAAGRRAVVPSVRGLEAVAKELDVVSQQVKTKGGAMAARPVWLEVCDPENWVPSDRLWLFALSGCSWSEAAGIRKGDDHGDHLKLARVWPRGANGPRDHGKADSRIPRDVPVPERLRPVIDRLTAYARSEYLLSGPDGQRLSYETWRHQMGRATDAAGYAITTHGLRHFAASLWIKAGASSLLVMKAGGWSSLDMVGKVYGHLWPSDVVELGRKVSDLDWENLA